MTAEEFLDTVDLGVLEYWYADWERLKKYDENGAEVIYLDVPPPDKRLSATKQDIEAAIARQKDA